MLISVFIYLLFQNPINNVLPKRFLFMSPAFAKAQAGRYKRTRDRSKGLTYEQFNAPHQIHHRKSWNSWNTSTYLFYFFSLHALTVFLQMTFLEIVFYLFLCNNNYRNEHF